MMTEAEVELQTKLDRQDGIPLTNHGYVVFEDGPPESWFAWPLLNFVSAMHTKFARQIAHALEQCTSLASSGRPGNSVAEQVGNTFYRYGIQIYTPHPSEDKTPRYYVDILGALEREFTITGKVCLPPVPSELWQLLQYKGDVVNQPPLLRACGWTLAPPGALPQEIHYDVRGNRGDYHHMLWKTDGTSCTTHLVPGVFSLEGCTLGEREVTGEAHASNVSYSTLGVTPLSCRVQSKSKRKGDGTFCESTLMQGVFGPAGEFNHIVQACGRALVYDSTMVHRGGDTKCSKDWVSTCSIELCSPTGDPEVFSWDLLPLGRPYAALYDTGQAVAISE